ncbi:hypothetical protein EK21DRAFT_58253 [Setomelanomma holmii]|uniref:Uncharacterized protein n=1 Tax=Setomelanomma holmii TaxID=210430 RepID=A0A9P4HF42_9PLEO|nr:hypothetical protein EK21DRAFT_58253 [Setomelanomma holmii]
MCEGVTHLAANLLLCILEMQHTGANTSCWVGYICGVKHVVDAVGNVEPSSGTDASLILGWVFYFDVMSRMTNRHWRTEHIEAVAEGLGYISDGSTGCKLQYIRARTLFARGVSDIANHAHPIVRLLAEVSETAMFSSDPRYLTNEYQQNLDDLRFRLENVSTRRVLLAGSAQDTPEHIQSLLGLTRLAGLIYLERVSRSFSGQSAKIDSWTQQALAILARLDSCFCPFALLVVSCETSQDEDRMIILDLFARMEKQPHLQSLLEAKALIQTAWNQQDLAEGEGLEYIHKINVVLSSREAVPSLI